MLSDQAARQSVTMIKKASGIFLLYLLRSTLCIPLSEFYPFGQDTAETNQRLGDGNRVTSGEAFYDGHYKFYGQFAIAVTVSCHNVDV